MTTVRSFTHQLLGLVLLLTVGCTNRKEQTVRQLTVSNARNGQATFSPDGDQIAYVSNQSGSWQVWLMNVDGTGSRRVTDRDGAVGWPSFDPDGSHLYYYAQEANIFQLFRTRTGDGGNGKPVFTVEVDSVSDFRPSISPDGQFLLFDRWSTATGNHDIFRISLGPEGIAIGSATQLTANPGYDSDARFSPDGSQILFHSDRDGTKEFEMQVFVMNADGEDVRRLTEGPDRHLYPSWCVDGRRIVLVRERSVEGGAGGETPAKETDRDIVGLDLASGQITELVVGPFNDSEPVLSPDGRTLLFTTDRYGVATQELATMETTFCSAK